MFCGNQFLVRDRRALQTDQSVCPSGSPKVELWRSARILESMVYGPVSAEMELVREIEETDRFGWKAIPLALDDFDSN